MTPTEHLLRIESLLHRCRVRLALSVGCAWACLGFCAFDIVLLLPAHNSWLTQTMSGIQVGLAVAMIWTVWRSYLWWKLVREIRRNTLLLFGPKTPAALRELANDQADAAYERLKQMNG